MSPRKSTDGNAEMRKKDKRHGTRPGHQFRLPFKKAIIKRRCQYCGDKLGLNPKVKTCGSLDCRRKYSLDKGTLVSITCEQCENEFISPKTANRKYCSYQCHIASGGAYRAGAASAVSRFKRGGRKDENHDELVAALEKMGVGVIDTSDKGGGFPDLICAVRHETLLVEVKNLKTGYGRRGLNKNQKKFAQNWRGGPVYVIKDIDDCVLLANFDLDSLYAYGGFKQVNVVNSSKNG